MKKVNIEEICNLDEVPFFLGLFGGVNGYIEPMNSRNSNAGYFNRNVVLNLLEGYLSPKNIQTIFVSPEEISFETYNQLLKKEDRHINTYFERIKSVISNNSKNKKFSTEIFDIKKEILNIKPLHLPEELSKMEYIINCYNKNLDIETKNNKKPLLYLVKNE